MPQHLGLLNKSTTLSFSILYDDVVRWKHLPRYFVRGIHRPQMTSPHKVQWRWALMFSLICIRISSWVNSREAGDLRRHCAHDEVIVMQNETILVYHGKSCLCHCINRDWQQLQNIFAVCPRMLQYDNGWAIEHKMIPQTIGICQWILHLFMKIIRCKLKGFNCLFRLNSPMYCAYI